MADPEETETDPAGGAGYAADAAGVIEVSTNGSRPHRKLVMTLIVVAVLVGFLSLMSTWLLRQTLDDRHLEPDQREDGPERGDPTGAVGLPG